MCILSDFVFDNCDYFIFSLGCRSGDFLATRDKTVGLGTVFQSGGVDFDI